MDAKQRVLDRKLYANSDGNGSHAEVRTGIEWTPGGTSSVPIKSTWRGEIGRPLTNGIIKKRAAQGFYGQKAKSLSEARSSLVISCVRCGGKSGVVFRKYSYLPQPGYYCETCREHYRGDESDDKAKDRKFSALLKAAAAKEYI